MMKVVNIIEEGRLGGPQIRMAQVARALQDRVNTTIMMPKYNSAPFSELCESLQVPYRRISIYALSRRGIAAFRYVLSFLSQVAHLTYLLKRSDCQIVHVSGGSWQYKGVIAGYLSRKKVLWHLNDTSMPWVVRKIFATMSRFSDGYIFASERSRRYYSSLTDEGKPVFVIPAPVDTTAFDPQRYQKDDDVNSHWHGKTVIGTVANINPAKSLDVCIRTAAILEKERRNLVFAIVGNVYSSQARYYDSLIALASELSVGCVQFLGSRRDVRPLLGRFDVYVCTSMAESSPISVWEAMSMAKPVVSTNVGDVPLYVRDGESGFVVDVGDAEAFADRLCRLVNSEQLRRKFGKAGRDIARRELDLRHCVERHAAAYENMLQSSVT